MLRRRGDLFRGLFLILIALLVVTQDVDAKGSGGLQKSSESLFMNSLTTGALSTSIRVYASEIR
jgi:hypothetical protein